MSEDKSGFVLFASYRRFCKGLSHEQLGQIFEALLAHNAGEDVPELSDPHANVVYMVFAESADRMRKYSQEKAEAGRKGGQAGSKQTEADLKQGQAEDKQASSTPQADAEQNQAININENINENINNNINTYRVADAPLSLTGESEALVPEVLQADSKVKKSKAVSSRFLPPSVDEVGAYCQNRQNGIDPQGFCDYYAAQGWKLANGQPLKDWQAAIRLWERRNKESPAHVGQIQPRSVSDLRYLDSAARGKALIEATLQRREQEKLSQQNQNLPPEWR